MPELNNRTLSQWEASAKFFIDLKNKIESVAPNTGFMNNEADLSAIVLALMDLVRKKDEALMHYYSATSIRPYLSISNGKIEVSGRFSDHAEKALALTEELK